MDETLLSELKKTIKGEVATDEATLTEYSHDASLFEVKPQVVVYPEDEKDIEDLINFVEKNKKKYPHLSLTGRAAGTDMGGGSINDSIIVAFGKHFNKTPVVKNSYATTEPGVFYRDFEKVTLKHHLIFPSYPASRSICAMGGIVNNDSGGERSLEYGTTRKYIKRVKVVLRDGKSYELKEITEAELKKKMAEKNVLGEIYRKMFKLISDNYDLIMSAPPKVSKNVSGYALWEVWDKQKKTFDLKKLWVGAQGTLGLLLEADVRLVPTHKHNAMLVIYLNDLNRVGEVVDKVLPLGPESFESYDDNTLKLALRFFPEFAKQLGLWGLVQAGFAFLPAFMQMFMGRLPKLIMQVNFSGNDLGELRQKIDALKKAIGPMHLHTTVAIDDQQQKYWLVRRESFNLLRHKIRDKHTAPFIDDFVVEPHKIATVLPQITAILKKHPEFIFTVAGHVGNGNFHIIPLVDIKNPKVREEIPEIAKKVYEIITKNGGAITGEHNDGLIRTPYLEQMYGKKMVKLFAETKKIWDPDDIFNPRKKVGGTIKYAMDHVREHW